MSSKATMPNPFVGTSLVLHELLKMDSISFAGNIDIVVHRDSPLPETYKPKYGNTDLCNIGAPISN